MWLILMFSLSLFGYLVGVLGGREVFIYLFFLGWGFRLCFLEVYGDIFILNNISCYVCGLFGFSWIVVNLF